MIKNDRQYRLTKARVAQFEETLDRLLDPGRPDHTPVHPRLRAVQADAVRGQRDSLRTELDEYERLRDGQQRRFELRSFDDLPRVLIQARIASGLTQRDLADRLDINERQVQRYEATDYASASLTRVSAVIAALGIETGDHLLLTSHSPNGEG